MIRDKLASPTAILTAAAAFLGGIAGNLAISGAAWAQVIGAPRPGRWACRSP